ncbi:hypothetical protein Tco_1579089 [Tanacetum coccineum]
MRDEYVKKDDLQLNLRTPFITQGSLSSSSSGKSLGSGNLGSGRNTLEVENSSSSGNHITNSGNALAFYSQHLIHQVVSQLNSLIQRLGFRRLHIPIDVIQKSTNILDDLLSLISTELGTY